MNKGKRKEKFRNLSCTQSTQYYLWPDISIYMLVIDPTNKEDKRFHPHRPIRSAPSHADRGLTIFNSSLIVFLVAQRASFELIPVAIVMSDVMSLGLKIETTCGTIETWTPVNRGLSCEKAVR